MKTRNLMAIGMIGLMLATALGGCVGGEKGTTGGTGGTGGGTGGGAGNATGNQTDGNQTPSGKTNTITLYFTLKDGNPSLTKEAPTASEYQTANAAADTTPALSGWVCFSGDVVLPEDAKIKKAVVKYWYTADGAAVVDEADACIAVDGQPDRDTRTSQERTDVIAAGQVIEVEFNVAGKKYDAGTNIGAGVMLFGTSGAGQDTPVTLKIVFGSTDYPSSITFVAGSAIFDV